MNQITNEVIEGVVTELEAAISAHTSAIERANQMFTETVKNIQSRFKVPVVPVNYGWTDLYKLVRRACEIHGCHYTASMAGYLYRMSDGARSVQCFTMALENGYGGQVWGYYGPRRRTIQGIYYALFPLSPDASDERLSDQELINRFHHDLTAFIAVYNAVDNQD